MKQVSSGTQTGMAPLNRKQKSSGELAARKCVSFPPPKKLERADYTGKCAETQGGEGRCFGGDSVTKARAPCLAVSPSC